VPKLRLVENVEPSQIWAGAGGYLANAGSNTVPSEEAKITFLSAPVIGLSTPDYRAVAAVVMRFSATECVFAGEATRRASSILIQRRVVPGASIG